MRVCVWVDISKIFDIVVTPVPLSMNSCPSILMLFRYTLRCLLHITIDILSL